MIGIFLGTGVILLVQWLDTRSALSLSAAIPLLAGAAILFTVKASESIELVEFRGYEPVGKTGSVTLSLRKGVTGSVRVDGLDWSATSEEVLEVGDEVVVLRREGVHLLVQKIGQSTRT